jgi:lysozyme
MHEGRQQKAYRDPLVPSIITIGVGRNISESGPGLSPDEMLCILTRRIQSLKFHPNLAYFTFDLPAELDDFEIDYLLNNDLAAVSEGLARTYRWFTGLDDVRQAVVIDMGFNLGLARFAGFKRTIAAIEAANYEGAAALMLQSAWARQVGRRARRLSEMMKTGAWWTR